MLPFKTSRANYTFTLAGDDTGERDLHAEVLDTDDGVALLSAWKLDDEERKRIADGADLALVVWGQGHPPVALRLLEDDER